MKIFRLVFNNKTIALSKDKWLIELYIVQRHLDQSKLSIEKQKNVDNNVIYLDDYLSYYYGYSIANFEKAYIEFRGIDIKSDIHKAIKLVNKNTSIKKGKKKLVKKDMKKYLKKIEKDSSIPNITLLLNELDSPNDVYDYLLNQTMFKDKLENED